MDHGPFGDQDGSGLKVMVDDMALQQAAGIAIDTAPLSRLQWDGVSPSLRSCKADVFLHGSPQRTANPAETR